MTAFDRINPSQLPSLLVKGSAEINRMRSELATVTGMIIGLLNLGNSMDAVDDIDDSPGKNILQYLAKKNGCYWLLYRSLVDNKLEVTCTRLHANEEDYDLAYTTSKHPETIIASDNGENMGVEGIRYAHSHLSLFVSAMCNHPLFPDLKKKLWPFIEAGMASY